MTQNLLENCINRGGVFYQIKGETTTQIFKNISQHFTNFDGVSPEDIFDELCLREQISSTTMGNGIAFPHARSPILKNAEEECVLVCFLDKPIMLDSIDNKATFVMFVILTSTRQSHLTILSNLAFLCGNKEFQKKLEMKPSKTELLESIKLLHDS
ncbi:MAG: PTS sugar transporter subunit IIA [Treponemataceae bacterium]